MALASFIPSITGMEAQSHAIGQISGNIANIRTVGYKTNQTLFYTLLGSNPVVKGNNSGINSSRTDITGVGYYDRTNILDPGVIQNTGGNYDVAINNNNNAFFMVQDSFGNDYYTRAGEFSTRTQNGQTYLVNGNGLRVQGYASADGKDTYAANPSDIIIKYPDNIPPKPTTEASITANVPADGVDSSSYALTIYADNHNGETMNMIFQKVDGQPNTWNLSFSVEGGTATGSATEVVFDSKGQLLTPKTLDVSINWNDGDTNSISLDISNMTQYAGGTGTTNVNQDGAPAGSFVKSFIDKDGVVKATYSNGDSYNFAKLTLVGFTAPENLSPFEGTLFEANGSTGEAHYIKDVANSLVSQAVESSATDITEEFGTMLITQRAYTSNANAFTVNNEMLQTLLDLKS